jgi:hypothetical protein
VPSITKLSYTTCLFPNVYPACTPYQNHCQLGSCIEETYLRMRRFDLIYIGIAITGRASATACEQGDKHPVVLFNIPAKGQREQDAQYQSSNSCMPATRYNSDRNCVQTMRFNCPSSSSFIQQQPFEAACQPEPTLFMVPSLTPASSSEQPTTAQQGSAHTAMTQEPG